MTMTPRPRVKSAVPRNPRNPLRDPPNEAHCPQQGAPVEEIGHVRMALAGLGPQINELANVIDILRSRLQPVLLEPRGPQVAGDRCSQETTCEVAEGIVGKSDELSCLERQVRDLIDRLDV